MYGLYVELFPLKPLCGFFFFNHKCMLILSKAFAVLIEIVIFFSIFFFFFFFLLFLWAAPAAYGGSQARGPIGAVATGLRQSHSNAGSEPCLQPTPQLTAMPDR